jgi:predicted TIM-barrel fold metal-dependent hydrolase
MSETERTRPNEGVVIISSDGHAGADLDGYREYLSAKWRDDFDAWRRAVGENHGSVLTLDPDRNWNGARRAAELEAQGVLAEVLFPNTLLPFANPPNGRATSADHPRAMAGVRAHNRWMRDFCADLPGRRAGVLQIMLDDLDDALEELRWGASEGFVTVALPGVAPGSSLPPLYAPDYEDLYAAIADLDMTITCHGGSGLPDFGPYPAAAALVLAEINFWSHRTAWHLIFGGVFDRHPMLRLVLTEQGISWVPGVARTLDEMYARMLAPGGAEERLSHAGGLIERMPSEYFATNIYVGASFMRPIEGEHRADIGVDRIMWGADYPHVEGVYPYAREAIRGALASADEPELRDILGRTAAHVYRFDLNMLQPLADKSGPTIDELLEPLVEFPDSPSPTFSPGLVRNW